MVLFPLTLGVGSGSDAESLSPSQRKSNAEKTLKRDDYTCRFCGFHAEKFQRSIPWVEAGNPPFATVCVFCEQVLHLERAGTVGAGLLLWLPEISQADLNHLARAIYVARADKSGPMEALASRALDALTTRRAEAKKRLGSDDPMLLATIMKESLDKDEVSKAAAKLEGIRLLPSEKYMMRGPRGDANQFPQLVKYWATSSLAAWPTAKWKETLQSALTLADKA